MTLTDCWPEWVTNLGWLSGWSERILLLLGGDDDDDGGATLWRRASLVICKSVQALDVN